MDMVEKRVEVRTGVTSNDEERGMGYEVRLADLAGPSGRLVKFRLTPEQAFLVHTGAVVNVEAKVSGEVDVRDLIAEQLDMLTSDTGLPTERSLEQIVNALFPVYSGKNHQVLQTLLDILAGDWSPAS